MEKLIHVLLTVKPLPSSISSRLLPLYLCIINSGVLLVVRSVLLYTVPSQEDTKHFIFFSAQCVSSICDLFLLKI